MDPNARQEEIYRLLKENNKMLHAMRRNAFWGGLFKIILYGALFLAPLWFYMTYLHGTVQRMVQTMEQVQGAGNNAQVQLSNFQELLRELQSKMPGFMRGTSTNQ